MARKTSRARSCQGGGSDAVEWRAGGDVLPRAVSRSVACATCAGLIYDVDGSRRACVRPGGCAGCGGRAAPAAQKTRSKRRHSAKVANYRLAALAGVRLEQNRNVCIWHDRKRAWHVRCQSTPASRIQGRTNGGAISPRQARRKSWPAKAVRLSTVGHLVNASARRAARRLKMEAVTSSTK